MKPNDKLRETIVKRMTMEFSLVLGWADTLEYCEKTIDKELRAFINTGDTDRTIHAFEDSAEEVMYDSYLLSFAEEVMAELALEDLDVEDYVRHVIRWGLKPHSQSAGGIRGELWKLKEKAQTAIASAVNGGYHQYKDAERRETKRTDIQNSVFHLEDENHANLGYIYYHEGGWRFLPNAVSHPRRRETKPHSYSWEMTAPDWAREMCRSIKRRNGTGDTTPDLPHAYPASALRKRPK